jgi:hypothetical protein
VHKRAARQDDKESRKAQDGGQVRDELAMARLAKKRRM